MYEQLKQRLQDGETVVLDGAVGTQLQHMGVPMNNTAWAAVALQTHPDTVRRVHEKYIEAGADVITTNTYSSARHNLEPLGLGDLTAELNLRGVVLAREARDRTAADHPVLIAGSISGFGLTTGGEARRSLHRYSRERSAITAEQAVANLHEQAELLADAGVDLILVESTGSQTQRKWIVEAAAATGLPVWVGFKCRVDADGGAVRIGYSSDQPLADAVDEVMALGGSVVNVFHSTIADTEAALPLVRERWKGPIGVYPDAGRPDYTAERRDDTLANEITPEAFLEHARGWADQGVQIIGGCCGYGVGYIRPLREGLAGRRRRA